ncbi:MAG TPA: anthranilate synthase component I family protein [Chitinophagaceae bacterium]|nr:anthranilate synthase component I family protein [Chitinophagaceae bacterium]
MKRKFISFPTNNILYFKRQMLHWINQFSICCLLDNHQYQSAYNSYECLAGAGFISCFKAQTGTALKAFQNFCDLQSDWLFGHLSYDLKNETEGVTSANFDGIGFDDILFFVPQYVFYVSANQVQIGSLQNDHEKIYSEISSININQPYLKALPVIKQRITRDEYIQNVISLQKHILRGDCYEINYCQEFFSQGFSINPVGVYASLNKISPNPFSCFYKTDNKYLLCASPERYLKKQLNKVLSQPIKGTWPRNRIDALKDIENKNLLFTSEKDRSENVMVVDLVRNDLSKICKEGTVTVEELFGVYTYPQVHQMISTVSGELREGISISEIISSTFPMGSMTGAPKHKVLELIEKYEKTKRGLFSGAVGYITPTGDFDFNVVIRSILYNSDHKYLSYQTGSGITYYSDAEKEYDECLLKAEAIKEVLGP